MKDHNSPPLFYQDSSVVSKGRTDSDSGSFLMNFMGLSLKGYCIQNPNKVLWTSQEIPTVRGPRVTQGQSESWTGRRDAPGLQQRGAKGERDAVTVQWITFRAFLCKCFLAQLH